MNAPIKHHSEADVKILLARLEDTTLTREQRSEIRDDISAIQGEGISDADLDD